MSKQGKLWTTALVFLWLSAIAVVALQSLIWLGWDKAAPGKFDVLALVSVFMLLVAGILCHVSRD